MFSSTATRCAPCSTDPADLSAGALQYLGGGPFRRTAHGAEHAPGQVIARELRQQPVVGGVHGDIPQSVQKSRGLAGDMPPLGEQRHGDEARVQRGADHLGAFRDKQPVLWPQPVLQLVLRQPGVHVQRRIGKILYFHDIGHLLSLDIPEFVCVQSLFYLES